MKILIPVLAVLFLLLQYELWFAKGGLVTAWRLKHSITQQKKNNQKLQARNAVLIADLKNLKQGNQAVEERARNELGMIKKGEVFYQVVTPSSSPAKSTKKMPPSSVEQ